MNSPITVDHKNARQRNYAITAGAIISAILLFTIVGIGIDLYPNSIGTAPSWSYVFSEGTLAAWAEKLFISFAIGFMLGIIPIGILALFGTAAVMVYRESMTKAKVVQNHLLSHFGEYDHDQDQIISSHEIKQAYAKSEKGSNQDLLFEVVKAMTAIGEVLPDKNDKAAVYITRSHLEQYPGKVRRTVLKGLFILPVVLTLILFILAGVLPTWLYLTILAVIFLSSFVYAEVRRAKMTSFVLRNFNVFDSNNDGEADMFEIISSWPKLSESDKPQVANLINCLEVIGHNSVVADILIPVVTRPQAQKFTRYKFAHWLAG